MGEEIKINKLDIADIIEENVKAEADAITDYNNFLQRLKNSSLSKIHKEAIEKEIYEIIGDELNHQDRLKMLYVMVTSIKENKE